MGGDALLLSTGTLETLDFVWLHTGQRVLVLARGSRASGVWAEAERNVIVQGVVVANDVDMKRCGMLTHQTKRASSPTLLVLNHDAQHFPALQVLNHTPVLPFVLYTGSPDGNRSIPYAGGSW